MVSCPFSFVSVACFREIIFGRGEFRGGIVGGLEVSRRCGGDQGITHW